MRKWSIGMACLIAALGVSPAVFAADAKGALDGKTFVGESGEKGKTKTSKEEIHFANGRFHSVPCDAYGFGDGPYTATKAGDGTVNWSAETASPKEGRIEWKGTVKGDALNGTFVWTKAGQAPIEYWMKATAQK